MPYLDSLPPITAPRFENSTFEVGESSHAPPEGNHQSMQPARTLFQTLGIQEWANPRQTTGLLQDMVQHQISSAVPSALPQPSPWMLGPIVSYRQQDVLPDVTPVCSISLDIIEGVRRLAQSL